MKKVLVIKGHTRSDSYCDALADRYIKGSTEAGNQVQVLRLTDLNLEDFLKYQHRPTTDYPEMLTEVHEQMKWADHLVFVYPTWWGLPPGLVKTFIEVGFAPKVAFRYLPLKGRVVKVEKLFRGKSARLISTMDAPPFYYNWFMGDPGGKAMKRTILNFCGISPVKKSYFGSVKVSTAEKREKWLKKIESVGRSD